MILTTAVMCALCSLQRCTITCSCRKIRAAEKNHEPRLNLIRDGLQYPGVLPLFQNVRAWSSECLLDVVLLWEWSRNKVRNPEYLCSFPVARRCKSMHSFSSVDCTTQSSYRSG